LIKPINLLSMRMPPRGVMLLANDDGTAVLERTGGETVRVLSEADAIVFRENPHLQQALINDGRLQYAGAELAVGAVVIPRDWLPSSAYQARRKDAVRTLPENAARARLLALIYFLTKHGAGATTVVVAAEAGNGMVDFIPDLFPNLRFVIFGDASKDVTESPLVETHPANFTDDDAERYQGQEGVLFVCSYSSPKGVKATANNLWADMKDQRRWAKTIRPAAAMLKFRLPFTPPAGESDYFDGEIMIQPWAQTAVNMTFLMVTDMDSVRTYDHGDFEGYMYHHNRYTRQQYYEQRHEVTELNGYGLDHGWDSAAELQILQYYTRELAQGTTSDQDRDKALALSARLSGLEPDAS